MDPNAASTDYFRGCGIYDLLVPPGVIYGWQQPHSGDAFVGGYSFSKLQPELREYIQTELTEPLDSGRYKVSFYVSLADDVIYSVSSMGAYLSADAISSNDVWVLDVEPQIQNPANNQLSDTSAWVLITDTFVSPVGGERFITIGNFNSAANSDTLLHGAPGSTSRRYAYYYIDDVSVIALGRPDAVKELEQIAFDVYPNPATDFIQIECPQPLERIRLLDIRGREVFAQDGAALTIDLQGISNGLYFLEVQTTNGRSGLRKVVVEW